MKNLKMSIAVMLLFIGSLTHGQEKMGHDHGKMNHGKMNAENMAPEFNDKNIANSYKHYIHIKASLVSSDSNEAKKGATMLVVALKNINGADLAVKAAKKMESSKDLNSQRVTFSELSNAMIDLVKGNLKSGKIYKDFCPMANNNNGAYWLSSEKEIRNPYYGDQMLTCGAVKETIE